MLEAIYSVGPILEGIGLNITAWSYADASARVGARLPDQCSRSVVDRRSAPRLSGRPQASLRYGRRVGAGG